MSVSRPGRRSGFSRSHRASSSSGVQAGPILHAHRVADAPEELDVRAVELAGAVADPHHVGRAVVPVAGQGVDAGQALLVGEDQRLVAREEVDLVQALLGAEVDPAGGHEPQRAVDLRRDALVALSLGRRRDELLVPQVHLGEVGEPSLGERAQQVERRRRLLVGGDEALGVGPARLGLEGVVVDHVAAERRRARRHRRVSVSAERGLANCPAMRPTFTTGTPAA